MKTINNKQKKNITVDMVKIEQYKNQQYAVETVSNAKL